MKDKAASFATGLSKTLIAMAVGVLILTTLASMAGSRPLSGFKPVKMVMGGPLTYLAAIWDTLPAALIVVAGVVALVFLYDRRSSSAPRKSKVSTVAVMGAPRAQFLQELEQTTTADADLTYSLILFDVDGFKIINDRLGPEIADEVLAYIAHELPSWLPLSARVARFGSDEFLVFLPNTIEREARDCAHRVLEAIAAYPFSVKKHAIPLSLSAGVSAYPGTSRTLRDAISQAASALHEAKGLGRNTVIVARSNSAGLCRLGAQVECALSDRRMHAAYQPIVDLQTGRPVAEEGLARIVTPEGRILSAYQFMGAATDLRLTSRIDHCLIGQALERCREQSLRGDNRLRFMNVSAALLRERRMLEEVAMSFSDCSVLGEFCGERNPLVVEITERELLSDPKAALDVLRPLLDIGVRLAIDDFGSGYSSFLYLTSLPISFLKIEMELLQSARQSKRARSILKGIRVIADDLGMTTIAEGIEDEELATIARDLGIDWGQGFYFGRPVLGEPSLARVSERGSLATVTSLDHA